MSKPIYECLFKCVDELEFEKGYNNVEIFYKQKKEQYEKRRFKKHSNYSSR